MRYNRLFGKSPRAARQEICVRSYGLLLRAGHVRPLGQGPYSFVFLGSPVVRNLRHNVVSPKHVAGVEVGVRRGGEACTVAAGEALHDLGRYDSEVAAHAL